MVAKITKRSRTSARLILYIILFSSLITLFITLTQLYFEYNEKITNVNNNIKNIKTGYIHGITNSVWLDDKKQLLAILEGINALPDIEYIEVVVDSKLYFSSGKKLTENVVRSSFPLHYEYDGKLLNIGTTFIEADLSGVYRKLINRTWVLLGSNAIKTFLVVIFMYFLFDRLVFRRLNQIFNFVQQHDIRNLDKRIDMNQINSGHKSDEISGIADALNIMQEHLNLSLTELLQLKTTLDLSLDAVVMFNPDGYQFFYANTGAAKLLGYSVEELMTMTPGDICLDFGEENFTNLINIIRTNIEHATHIETIFNHRSGRRIPVKIILQYINPENEEPRYVLIARDITQRKENDLILLKSLEKTKVASAAKTKFMMSMSHELRTPLNAILGFSQLLELDADTLTSNQNDSVKDILRAGRHLLELVEGILDLSKIESDNIDILFELTNPVNLLDECVKNVYLMASIKNIKLENKTTGISLPEISIDQTRFKQVMLNLLSNAIKYSANGSLVTLTCDLLPMNIIRFKVSDTGYGIKASEQINVFTPFNRLGHEGGMIEGTGIGLSITKRLVEMMNGTIDFHSREGKGSDFWIDFSYPEDSSFLKVKKS